MGKIMNAEDRIVITCMHAVMCVCAPDFLFLAMVAFFLFGSV
jgi:hypothetical protein